MLSFSPISRAILIGLLLAATCTTQGTHAQKSDYMAYIKKAADDGWTNNPAIIERWKDRVDPSVLWGYNSPSHPIYLADVLGFLYEETEERFYAERAATLLAEYGTLRDAYPEDYYTTRVEYSNGVPALSNFFFLPPYSRAYLRIATSDVLSEEMRVIIERDLSHSLDFQFHFPEWGAHNRAMLRAEGWYYGALAIPDHEQAGKWKKMAEIIAADNLDEWEVEDASGYQAVWLTSVFSYAEITGQEEAFFRMPIIRYYAEYFKRMFTPAHTLPAFGDSNWNPSWDRFIAIFEKYAAVYQDPEMKWIADKLFARAVEAGRYGVGAASHLALAYRWADESIIPQKPTSGSQEVLEDIAGKKIVFRDGWDATSTYMLLNYRDEGDGGIVHRNYLRNTLTVEEEKMHHGQADENDIALLMSNGSVLLHSSGYRSGLPSGPFGQFRADYYQNKLVVRKNKRDVNQSVANFLHNSGAYRPVRTQKIDFATFDDVEMSRTRLQDDQMGYTWDRIITYLKEDNAFIVVDAIQSRVSDFYTYTNLWHTRNIIAEGPQYFVTSIDSIRNEALPVDTHLLVRFLDIYAKDAGHYAERRHFQDERAIYQTQSSHYKTGDYEVFVTLLQPIEAGDAPGPYLEKYSLLKPDTYPAGLGIQIKRPASTSTLCLKIDLEAELARENIRPRYTWAAGKMTCGAFETDAHFFYASETADALFYAATQFLNIYRDGQPILEALPNTHGLQPDGSPPKIGYTKWRAWEDVLQQ
ncbi:MAG: hypothetical protein AAF564_16655 [Bacteroidota bacterium]